MARMPPTEFEALWLALGPSPILVTALALTHSGAGVAATVSALPVWLKVLIWLVIVAHLGYRVADDGLRRLPDSPTALAWDAHGAWRLVTQARVTVPARLEPHAFVSPWLTVLPLRRVGGARTTVLIVPDCVDAEPFRRLRVRWRHERSRSNAE